MILSFPITADGTSARQQLRQRWPNLPTNCNVRVFGDLGGGAVTLQTSPTATGTLVPLLGGEGIDTAGQRTIAMTPASYLAVVTAGATAPDATVEVDC